MLENTISILQENLALLYQAQPQRQFRGSASKVRADGFEGWSWAAFARSSRYAGAARTSLGPSPSELGLRADVLNRMHATPENLAPHNGINEIQGDVVAIIVVQLRRVSLGRAHAIRDICVEAVMTKTWAESCPLGRDSWLCSLWSTIL